MSGCLTVAAPSSPPCPVCLLPSDRTADDRNYSTPMGASVAETASEIEMKVDDDEALDVYDSV